MCHQQECTNVKFLEPLVDSMVHRGRNSRASTDEALAHGRYYWKARQIGTLICWQFKIGAVVMISWIFPSLSPLKGSAITYGPQYHSFHHPIIIHNKLKFATTTGPANPFPQLVLRYISHSLIKCHQATAYVAMANWYIWGLSMWYAA